MLVQLYFAVGLAIIVSALCSIFEAVLYSVPLSHVEVLAKSGKRSGKVLKKLKTDIHKPIAAILSLNTIANTMGAAVAGAAAAVVFGDEYLGLFSVVFTLAILLLSEILPKTAGVAYSKGLATWIAGPLQFLVIVLSPLVWLIQAVTKLIPGQDKETLVSAEEIQAIAVISRKSGEIDPQQEEVIANILKLSDTSVRQVMTPRTVTFSLSKHLTVGESKSMFEKLDSHSRIPVYDKDSDDVEGIVLRKDILINMASGDDEKKLAELLQPVHFVPESAPLNRVLRDFFERRQHLFVVVDEYGSVTGVISMEDIIEEIIGQEIIDETDQMRDMREYARRRKQLTSK